MQDNKHYRVKMPVDRMRKSFKSNPASEASIGPEIDTLYLNWHILSNMKETQTLKEEVDSHQGG